MKKYLKLVNRKVKTLTQSVEELKGENQMLKQQLQIMNNQIN